MYKQVAEHEKMEGFYKHPFLENIYVTRDGTIYNDETEKLLYPQLSGGYKRISSLNERQVHALVCETFLEIPEEIKHCRLVVNHKNGIKSDNRLENLEWTTFSGNSKHAYETGLRKDNTPVLIKDLRTGQVVRYYSLQEAARAHKVNGANIFWYLKPEKIGNVFQKYYVVIREGMQWPNLGVEHIGKPKAGLSRDVMVFVKKSNAWHIFSNMRQVSEFLGIGEATVGMKLRRAISKSLTGYDDENMSLWFLDMFPKEIPENAKRVKVKTKLVITRRSPRSPIPISVTNIQSGEVKNFASSETYARSIGVGKNTFQKHIYKNNGIWKTNYRVQYLK